MAFLQRTRPVEALAHAAVLVQENLAVLLHPVQHLWEGEVGTGGGVFQARMSVHAWVRFGPTCLTSC